MSVIKKLLEEAEALEDSGDLVSAHHKWEQLNQLQPSALTGWRLGRNLMLQERLTEAQATLERTLTQYPNSAEAYFMLGFTLKKQNRLDPARELLTKGLQLQDWTPARVILGEVYRQLGDDQSAREHLQRAVTEDPSDSEAWYSLALTYRDHDADKAAEMFSKAIQSDNQNAAARRELGFVLMESGDVDQAVENLRLALELDPLDVWAHCYLGSAFKKLRRFSEAESETKRATKLMPGEPLFWCNLGDVLALQGKWDEAEKSYRTALSNDITHYLSNLRYAEFLERRGYPSRALRYVERAGVARPENPRIAEMLQRLRSQKKAIDQ